jgi:hypothetical protein
VLYVGRFLMDYAGFDEERIREAVRRLGDALVGRRHALTRQPSSSGTWRAAAGRS